MQKVEINAEPVELYKILKFEGLAASGGEAKSVIDQGMVKVNGETEYRRRRKIVSGDTIVFGDVEMNIQLASQQG